MTLAAYCLTYSYQQGHLATACASDLCLMLDYVCITNFLLLLFLLLMIIAVNGHTCTAISMCLNAVSRQFSLLNSNLTITESRLLLKIYNKHN